MAKQRGEVALSGRLRRKLRPVLEAIADNGAQVDEAERRTGGHVCLTIRLPDGRETRKVFASLSPSDHRATQNLVSLIRRTVQELRESNDG